MNTRFTRRWAAIGVLAALGGAAFAGVTLAERSHYATGQRVTPSKNLSRVAGEPVITRLRAIALGAAAQNGEQSPTDAIAYKTTRQDANARTSGAIVDSNQPVFLIVEHGNFVGVDVSLMYGSQAPRGRIISVIVDAATGNVTDWGYEPTEPRVNGLAVAAPLIP
jgi:hypothetical protein